MLSPLRGTLFPFFEVSIVGRAATRGWLVTHVSSGNTRYYLQKVLLRAMSGGGRGCWIVVCVTTVLFSTSEMVKMLYSRAAGSGGMSAFHRMLCWCPMRLPGLCG